MSDATRIADYIKKLTQEFEDLKYSNNVNLANLKNMPESFALPKGADVESTQVFQGLKKAQQEDETRFKQLLEDMNRLLDLQKKALEEEKQKSIEIVEKGVNAIRNNTLPLNAVDNVLNRFLNLNPNITVAVIKTFFTIATNEGKRMTDIVDMTGFPKSTVSRHLLDLGPATEAFVKGMGLIQIEHPSEEWEEDFIKEQMDGMPEKDIDERLRVTVSKVYRPSTILKNKIEKARDRQRLSVRLFYLSRKGQKLMDELLVTNDKALASFVTGLPI